MKYSIHHVVAGALVGLLGGCSTYQPLDQGSSVPWAGGGSSQPQALVPDAGVDRIGTGAPVKTTDLVGRVHRVQPGDTLMSVSRRYRVGVGELAAANDIESPFVIYVGDVLRIPSGADVLSVTARAEQHVVRRGETLHVIARRYGVSASAIARRNDLTSPDRLQVGQRLDLPGDEPATAAPGKVAAAPSKVAAAPSKGADKPATAPAPATVAAERDDGFVWPVRGKIIARFGSSPDGAVSHGITIAARKGTPIRAAAAGEVIYAGDAVAGYGRMVLIRHDDDYVTTYAHAQTLLVEVGQPVQRGQVIARVGDTGNVDRAQLHFELRKGRKPLDPEAHLGEPFTEVASTPEAGSQIR